MASPFTITSVSNYNANPPSDDGAQTAANRVQWSTQKTKLSDPVKNAFDTSETNTSTAFGKIIGGAGITSTAVDYTVTASDQGKIVKCTVSGKTITTPDATVVGSPFVFCVLNNSSGDITLDGNGAQTIDGIASFTVPSGCGCMLNTDGSNWLTDGQNFNQGQSPPQGRLTLASGTPILAGDATAATSVYYTPYVGDRSPISTDGATFRMRVFSELTLSLVSNHLASTIYDVFLFDNSGTLTIGTGPAWNNSTAGSGSRGTGAGTTELQRIHGIWTNKNSMTARNGATTYTVAANQGTYLGTILIDGSAGQVSCYLSYGQNRKWGVWNAYNRRPIVIRTGEGTASWIYTSSTVRPSNNNSGNSFTTLCGLAEEFIDVKLTQLIDADTGASGGSWSGTASATVGIGVNVTNAFTGLTGSVLNNNSLNPSAGAWTAGSIIVRSTVTAEVGQIPGIGSNVFTMLESASVSGTGSTTFFGSATSGTMFGSYAG